MTHDDLSTRELLGRIRGDDPHAAALDALLARYRQRLRLAIEMRLDRRVAARVDPSDIAQDTIAEAARRLPNISDELDVPVFVWLRQLALQRVIQVHRMHLAAGKRSVAKECRLGANAVDSVADKMARRLVAQQNSPSEMAARHEVCQRVRQALMDLATPDREVLVLRHMEQMSLREIAAALELTEAAVQSRYRRAVERIHRLLSDLAKEVS
ncbi:MAG: sigma-70 family RNA polymerase sigma factor [Pirellulaceae bacterium]|nr:sigma-70 family RNA polymerase sigma factor [Planctomycetales bacterium]